MIEDDNGSSTAQTWATRTSTRQEPLNPLTPSVATGYYSRKSSNRNRESNLNEGRLSDTLNTAYIDIQEEDQSLMSNCVRWIASYVGSCFSPHIMLVILRLLKILTTLFLVFTIFSNLMYLSFVALFVDKDVIAKIGGSRDTIIRLYGLLLLAIALIVELDITNFMKSFVGLKPFIPRSFLLFFIAVITNSPNLHDYHNAAQFDSYATDDVYNNDDTYDQLVSQSIPGSTVVFQTVTTFVLSFCAIWYFLLGLMCFDRFTPKAFISRLDPVQTTVIQTPSAPVPVV